VLTGEGSDEHFGGYPAYLPDYLREPDHAWPHNPLSEEQRVKQCRKTEDEVKSYYRSVGADSDNRKESVASRQLNNVTTVSSMAAFSFSMYSPWTSCYGISDPRLTIANNVDGRVRDQIMDKWHPLHAAQYIWSKGHLTNIFLTCLGDRTEMAHSVEARTPFLDHNLTEYVNNLPPSVKIRYDPEEDRFVEKWILREAAKPFITKELYERKKHPYSAPTTYPRDGPLHRLMKKLINKENVEKLGFVDWSRSQSLVDKAFGEQGDPNAMRFSFLIAQWVTLSQRFGVKMASPPEEMGEAAGVV
jgi:asparagine synthase (glutamine-hydrolysing)